MTSTVDRVAKIEEVIAAHYEKRVAFLQSLTPIAVRHGMTVMDLSDRRWLNNDAYDLVLVLLGVTHRGVIAVFHADTELDGPSNPELTKNLDDASRFCLDDIYRMQKHLNRIAGAMRTKDATVCSRIWSARAFGAYLDLLRSFITELDALSDA